MILCFKPFFHIVDNFFSFIFLCRQKKKKHLLTLYCVVCCLLCLCLLIIYFVGTRHSQWHTWVHHYFYLSWALRFCWRWPMNLKEKKLNKQMKLPIFHYLQIYDVPMHKLEIHFIKFTRYRKWYGFFFFEKTMKLKFRIERACGKKIYNQKVQ